MKLLNWHLKTTSQFHAYNCVLNVVQVFWKYLNTLATVQSFGINTFFYLLAFFSKDALNCIKSDCKYLYIVTKDIYFI